MKVRLILLISISIFAVTVFQTGLSVGRALGRSEQIEPPKQLLYLFAQAKIDDLASTGYWGHTNSDGCDFMCRVKRIYGDNNYVYLGENLYRGPCSVENAYKMWHDSPTHEEILKESYTDMVLLSHEYAPGQCYIIYNITR